MKETEDRQAEFNSLVMSGFKKAEIMKTMRMSGHSYWKHMKYLKSLPVVKPAGWGEGNNELQSRIGNDSTG